MHNEKVMLKKEVTPPKILWHYTSIENVINILDTGIMRATHYSFFNDDEELHRGAKIVLERFEALLKGKNIEIPKGMNLYDPMKQLISKKVYDFGYIISFSKNGDSLPQWMGYTPRNGGCAMGFNTKLLNDAFTQTIATKSNNTREKNFSPLNGVRACIYVDNDYTLFDEEMKRDFHILLGTIKTAIEKFNDKDYTGPNDYIMKLLEQGVCIGLMDFMARTKHPSFAFENECRLIFAHDNNFGLPKFNGVKPYLECKINKEFYKNLIKEIRVSPHGNQSNAIKSLEFLREKLCDELKLDNKFFHISKSKLSYRGSI